MANKAILVGCVGQDPYIHQFDNGSVASFSLATNETYKDKNGIEQFNIFDIEDLRE